MVFGLKGANEKNQAVLDVANAEAPQFEQVSWKSNPGLRKLYFWCSVLCVASATTGYDGMLLNTSQMMDTWQRYFQKPDGAKLGLMNSIYMIGSLCSFPVVPWLADKYGRRVPIAVGCILMLIGSVVGALSTSYGMYIGARFLMGFGNSGAQLSSPVLLTEICHPQHRSRVTSIYNCLWNVGALIVSLLGWATMSTHSNWGWRSLTLIQGLPSLIQIVFLYWVPESPRWLISKERYDEALDILAYYHANGDKDNTTVQFEWQEIKETLKLEFAAKKSSSYLDFFKGKGNRYRLGLLISVAFFSQYSGNAVISNYSNLIYEGAGITQQSKKIPLDAGRTALSLIVSLVAAMLVDRVGRRPLFLVSTAGMLAFFGAWTVTASQFEKTGNIKTSGYPQIAFIWLHGIAYALAWSGLLVAYSLEILPYRLRAKGLMIMNLVVQATLVLGGQTNPIAWKNLPSKWILSMIYTIWIFIELIIIYVYFVETKGPTLEELARIFDGDDSVAHIDLNAIEKDVQADHVSEINDDSEKRAPAAKTSAL